MPDPRLPYAKTVLQECFWGEYTLTAEDLLDRLDRQEPGFEMFIFSKIINNSRHPSRFLRILFPEARLQYFLHRELKRNKDRKRLRLVAANLLENFDLVPEHQWRI